MKRFIKKPVVIVSFLFFALLVSLLQFTPPETIYKTFIRPADASNLTNLSGVTGKVGKEDINFGTGQATDTFTVPTYSGGTVTLTKLPSLFANAASIIKGKWYVAAMAGDHGNAALTGSLAWVINTLSTDPATIELPGNQTYSLTTNLVIPETIVLNFQRGAILGGTGNISGSGLKHIQAGAWQIFSTSGTITFPDGSDLKSSWFADFETAITKISTAKVSLEVTEADTISNDCTLNANTKPVWTSAGKILTISSGKTLTFNSQIDAGLYQIIAGTGSAAAEYKVESIWFSSLNQAVASGAQLIKITPYITHTITSSISVQNNQTIEGCGIKSLVEFGANIDGFTIDGKTNVIIRDFKIDGKKGTYTTTSNSAISSPANGTGSSNIRIEGITIVDVAGSSIEILAQSGSHSENIKILNNTVIDSGGCGIITQDYVDDVMIRGNRIINYALIVSSGIGIATGRDSNNQQVIGNYIEDGGSSLGASPHGISLDRSTNGVISGNIVNGAQGYGIEIGFCTRVSVTGNEVYSTTKAGIALPGDDSNDYVNKHVSITGNTIYQPGAAGIYSFVDNYVDDKHEDITIVGNTVYNNQTEPGIYLGWTKNSLVEANTIASSYKAGIVLYYCDYVVATGNHIKNGNTSDTAGNYYGVRLDNSTFCPVNGMLEVDPESYSTSGTGEDILHTIDIPQYYYKDWHGLRLTASGIKSGAAGNKTIKFIWGSGTFTFNPAANDINDWRVTVDLLFRNYNTQRISIVGYNGTTLFQDYADRSEDMSVGDITFKVTGECADGADSITIRLWKLEVF